MKKIFCGLFVAFAVIALMSSSAFAGGCPMSKPVMMGAHDKGDWKMSLEDAFSMKIHFIMENSEEIGLSAEQSEKIHALKYSVKKGIIKSDAEIDMLALDIKEALGKDEVDTVAVNGLIDKKYALKAQKTKDIVAACTSLKTILTKEQQDKMKAMCSKHKKDKIEDEEEGEEPGMQKMSMGKE